MPNKKDDKDHYDHKSFKTYTIQSLTDYIDLLESLNTGDKEMWFRGQSSAMYRLTPSALRYCYGVADWKGEYFERPVPENLSSGSNHKVVFPDVDAMVEEFKKKAEPILEYTAANDIEWECIGQHYGLPTRMLDWTTNTLDALYFAIGEDKEKGKNEELKNSDTFKWEKEDNPGCTDDELIKLIYQKAVDKFADRQLSEYGGAVFIIDPAEINRYTILWEKGVEPCVLDPEESWCSEYIEKCLHEAELPICIHGFNKEKRISRQSGNFSTTGTDVMPLDYRDFFQPMITKIFIPYNCYKSIRKELRAIGITEGEIYAKKRDGSGNCIDDDKDVICRKIAAETTSKFIKQMENTHHAPDEWM